MTKRELFRELFGKIQLTEATPPIDAADCLAEAAQLLAQLTYALGREAAIESVMRGVMKDI